MAVHIVRFVHDDFISWGVIAKGADSENSKETILPIRSKPQKIDAGIDVNIETTAQLIALGVENIKQLVDTEHPIMAEDVTLLSPITSNQKVICQGANYRQHMIDSGMNPDQKHFNMFFTKSSASIHAPVGEIVKPEHVQLLDYEIELCLVIKQPIEHEMQLAKEDLHKYVAGICIGNDVSARDIQIPETQFYKGKSYRTFCPLGPVLCLLEAHEMHYLDELELTLKVNQQVRQNDFTHNMVYKPAETLSEMSQVVNFGAGDVVMTGTPSGCALSVPSPLLVKLSALIPEEKKWPLFIKNQKSNGRYLCVNDHIELSICSRDKHIDLGKQQHVIRFAQT